MRRSSTRIPTPPSPEARPRKFVLHGDTRIDEYAWLQDMKDPKVGVYFKAENDYADARMKGSGKLQQSLYKEIRARITEDDMSVPVKDGPYFYYTRTKKGKQYAIHCRRLGEKRKEEIFLDENVLAAGKSFFALGDTDISPDHRLLAYTTDETGNERFTLAIKDLRTGKLLPERIESVGAVVWAEDGRHFLYTKENHPFPPRQVWRHALGTSAQEDVLVHEEKDPQWYVHVGKSRSKKYLFISVGNFDASEEWFLPADKPLEKPRLIAKRKKKVKYSVEHWGDYFYITTNEKAVNYKVLRAPAIDPRPKNWRPWLPHDPARSITGFAAFKDFLAIVAREEGSEWVFLSPPEHAALKRIPLPETAHTVSFWDDLEFETPFVRLTYSSFLAPKTVYDYDPSVGKLVEKKKQKVPGWKPAEYTSERIWVSSTNGTKVPVSLCYAKKAKRNGTAPLLLQAYGSYGITHDPYFSVAQLSLLKRGWVLAIAHVRGGGEMGWNWHEVAKKTTKHRTYEDVIAVVDALVAKKYCARSRTAITGGSAGGMTMGAVLNMRPDLCGAAVVYVPNADTVSSMLDTKLGGTVLHYDELGDPRKPAEYRYLKKWSPYENVKKAAYPALLVRASAHDIRTPAWEAAKWVARLRARSTGSRPLLFKVETSAGHSGKSGRYEWIRERAWDYAFLIAML